MTQPRLNPLPLVAILCLATYIVLYIVATFTHLHALWQIGIVFNFTGAVCLAVFGIRRFLKLPQP